MKNAEIVKRGEIRSRKFYVVRRNVSGSFDSIVYSHLFGDEFGRDFFCGYLDVTGSRFDGKDDADLEGMTPCEITYGGRGVPGVGDQEASKHPGWFLGFDTAHAGMGDEDAESVFQTLVRLADAILDNAEARRAPGKMNDTPSPLSNTEELAILTSSHFVSGLYGRTSRALFCAVHALARRVDKKERNARSRAARAASQEGAAK